MSDIVVVKPPGKEKHMKSLISLDYGIITNVLKQEGFHPDQVNLEIFRRLSESRGKLSVDFSLFQKQRSYRYLKAGKDSEIESELEKIVNSTDLEEYNVFLFSVMHYKDFEFLLPLFRFLKEGRENIKIIVGGSAIYSPQDAKMLAKSEFIDFVFLGEPGNSLTKLLNNWNPEGLSGVFYDRNGEIVENKRIEEEIEEQPIPFYEKRDLKLAEDLTPFPGIYIPYQLGRGCRNNCAFCSYREKGGFQIKSEEKVLKDLKKLKREYKTTNFFFVDSNVLNDPDYMEEISEKFESLGINWGAQASILNKSEEFYSKLRRGGCIFLDCGLESGSDKILKFIRKPFNSEIASKSIKNAHKAGIKVALNTIVGMPSETREDFLKTKKFLMDHTKYIFDLNIFPFLLLKGSDMYENLRKYDIKISSKSENTEDRRDILGYLSPKKVNFQDMNIQREDMQSIKQRRIRELVKIKYSRIYFENFRSEKSSRFFKYMVKRFDYEPLEDCPFLLFS